MKKSVHFSAACEAVPLQTRVLIQTRIFIATRILITRIIMLDFLGDLKRTHMCGELRGSDAGSNVVLMGWVNRRRDLGNLIFLDLRDRSGITQVVITADAGAEVHDRATAVRSELFSYTHLRAHETVLDLVCRLLLEKKK